MIPRTLVIGALVIAVLLICNTATAQRFAAPDATAKYHRSRTVDVTHLKLEVTVNIRKGTVVGSSELSMTVIRNAATLELDAAEMTIEKVSAGNSELSFFHKSPRLTITLPTGTKIGDKLTIKVTYKANPKRGLYFVRPEKRYKNRAYQAWSQGETTDNRYWFPSYDFPDDRFSSEMLATVRAPYEAISNGQLKEVIWVNKGWRRFHWTQAKEHVNYLVTLVVGDYEEHKLKGHRVPMSVWVHKRHNKHWKRSFEKTKDMMDFFEEYLAYPYPWEKYDQVVVEDFLFGGMENTSASTMTSRTIHDERAELDFSSDGLVAHELAHQWFGDLITCRSWAHLWLNEGFATYFENLYVESRQGIDEGMRDRVLGTSWYLNGGYKRRMDAYRHDHPDDLFDGHTYAKGAWVLHMLRIKLGDKAFQEAVRHYVLQYQNKAVESDDLRRAFEESSGHELKSFFDQWVHRAGHPDFKVKWSWDKNAKAVRIKIKQKGTTYAVPMPIHVTTKDGEQLFTPTLDQGKQEVTLQLASEPLMVEFDRDATLLAEWKIKKHLDEWVYQLLNGKTVQSRRRAAKNLKKFKRANPKEKAARALEKALANTQEFYWVRVTAAASLGKLEAKDSAKSLLKALNDKNSRVRTAAASALGNFKGKAVHKALAHAFKKDASYKTAAAALGSYTRSGGKNAFDLIDDALDRDSHVERIRKAGIAALEELNSSKAFARVIVETAWGRPNPSRRAAAETLGRMADGNQSRKSKALKRLTELLDDPRFWVRYGAVKGLKSLGDRQAIDSLKKVAQDGIVRRIAREAERAVRYLESGAATPSKGELQKEVGPLKRKIQALEKRLDALEKSKK
jgi:aminopeptidase N